MVFFWVGGPQAFSVGLLISFPCLSLPVPVLVNDMGDFNDLANLQGQLVLQLSGQGVHDLKVHG